MGTSALDVKGRSATDVSREMARNGAKVTLAFSALLLLLATPAITQTNTNLDAGYLSPPFVNAIKPHR